MNRLLVRALWIKFATFGSQALLLTGALVLAPTLVAQEPPRGLPPFLEELNLTTQQRTQIQQIVEEERDATMPLVQQLRQSHQQTQKKIDALLTAKQREQLRQKREEMLSQGPPPF